MPGMKYISTRHNSPKVSFREALKSPIAPDGGLYLPENIPVLPKAVLANMSEMSLPEIGYVVLNATVGSDYSPSVIKEIAVRAFNIMTPIVTLDESKSVVELFEGPTLAFKDFGARLLAALLEQSLRDTPPAKPLNIIIATTGNTGSAMANALSKLRNVNVFIVFPRGTATRALESQFTTPGGNIYPVEVSGTIDACQTLVATALTDTALTDHISFTTANSGNPARLLGQTVYYFYAVSRLLATAPRNRRKIVVAVPSGNLGNLTAGVLAKRMGLEISRFVACENSNNYLSRAMTSEDFDPRPAIPTLAYAADKSVPTNLERLLDIYAGARQQMSDDITPVTVSDADIISAINDCHSRYNYLIDTHTALAYKGLNDTLAADETGLVLATAHPAKSLTAMSAITGRPIEMPLQLTRFMGRPDHRVRIKPVYSSLRRIIRDANNLK